MSSIQIETDDTRDRLDLAICNQTDHAISSDALESTERLHRRYGHVTFVFFSLLSSNDRMVDRLHVNFWKNLRERSAQISCATSIRAGLVLQAVDCGSALAILHSHVDTAPAGFRGRVLSLPKQQRIIAALYLVADWNPAEAAEVGLEISQESIGKAFEPLRASLPAMRNRLGDEETIENFASKLRRNLVLPVHLEERIASSFHDLALVTNSSSEMRRPVNRAASAFHGRDKVSVQGDSGHLYRMLGRATYHYLLIMFIDQAIAATAHLDLWRWISRYIKAGLPDGFDRILLRELVDRARREHRPDIGSSFVLARTPGFVETSFSSDFLNTWSLGGELRHYMLELEYRASKSSDCQPEIYCVVTAAPVERELLGLWDIWNCSWGDIRRLTSLRPTEAARIFLNRRFKADAVDGGFCFSAASKTSSKIRSSWQAHPRWRPNLPLLIEREIEGFL